ncbi:hypothetical protein F7O75_00475 [Neisseria meningitidis]|nr:hypothetical protein [Neisseria meningitidis]
MINSVLQPKNNHLASFPRRRESISEFGQSLFKSDELSFINGFRLRGNDGCCTGSNLSETVCRRLEFA